jgi:hypothetical protein
MAQTQLPSNQEEIARRGEELYADSLRARVETDDNIGRLIAIDVQSGDYEIGDELTAIGQKLRERHLDAEVWFKRIGYDAVYAIGGTLTRTAG